MSKITLSFWFAVGAITLLQSAQAQVFCPSVLICANNTGLDAGTCDTTDDYGFDGWKIIAPPPQLGNTYNFLQVRLDTANNAMICVYVNQQTGLLYISNNRPYTPDTSNPNYYWTSDASGQYCGTKSTDPINANTLACPFNPK